MENKKNYLLMLVHAKGLGNKGIRKLLHEYGTVENIFAAGWCQRSNLLFGKFQIESWERDLEIVEKEGVRLISYQDPLYPKNLLALPDFPILLYVKGTLTLEDQRGIAIIGTRNASLYGQQMAEKIASDVGAAGICVVSGLARGIDTKAHEGALKRGGRTLALIGSGLNKLYPQENRPLAEKIAENGAVISEYPMETPPAKGLFPQRNRLVSGISQGVCLIESPLKGGGMLTMEIASKHKKPLFVLPGRVDAPTFEGNHWLLKQKKALLIENGDDLLQYFHFGTQQAVRKSPSPLLSPEEELFLKNMPSQEKTIEELVLLTQLPIMQLNVLLTRLVLKKVMMEFPGKIYKKVLTNSK